MSGQRFFRGDRVKVADDLGPHMSHFRAGGTAIVIGLMFEPDNSCASWYEEHQLTLIGTVTERYIHTTQAKHEKANPAMRFFDVETGEDVTDE